MLDVKNLRHNIDEVAQNLLKRGFVLDVEKFNELEKSRKKLQVLIQDLQKSRNEKSKAIGIKKSKGEDASQLLKEMETIGEDLKNTNEKFDKIYNEFNDYLLMLPNLLHETVPDGNSEKNNEVIRTFSNAKNFTFKVKEHFEIAENINNSMDFELSSKLSGSRFVVLKDKIARLHRALGQFMLDLHIEKHGYREIYVPLLVKDHALYGTGQFPKFKEDQFGMHDEDYWLIPTGEVPLTNLVRDEILEEKDLPLKFVCLSTCFRKEAGSYGKDTKGMIRQHQFEKVELVQIVHPDKSYAALEELILHSEEILKKLDLHYRVCNLCAGDIGFSSTKTYDIEVWLPGQNKYREIASCSNVEDFQARRMQARVHVKDSKKPVLVHTLNGSGVAVGRALIAVIENYQDEKGRIHIPEVLIPYMGGLEVIE